MNLIQLIFMNYYQILETPPLIEVKIQKKIER
jgi:hypothetical protein